MKMTNRPCGIVVMCCAYTIRKSIPELTTSDTSYKLLFTAWF